MLNGHDKHRENSSTESAHNCQRHKIVAVFHCYTRLSFDLRQQISAARFGSTEPKQKISSRGRNDFAAGWATRHGAVSSDTSATQNLLYAANCFGWALTATDADANSFRGSLDGTRAPTAPWLRPRFVGSPRVLSNEPLHFDSA
jgi:hypothetical protein